MPARAVVFNSIRKHDGSTFRNLEPGELTQMSGRAGRRGLDKVGTVVFCCFGEVPPPQPILRQMLTGSSTLLRSQFRLTYNMILNLLRVEELSVESMIKRSFSEFATQRELTANKYPQLLKRGERALEKLKQQFAEDFATRIGADDVESYYEVLTNAATLLGEVVQYIQSIDPSAYETIFQTGRVLLINVIKQYGLVRAPAMILQSRSGSNSSSSTVSTTNANRKSPRLVCLALLPTSYIEADQSATKAEPGSIGYVGSVRQRYYVVVEIDVCQVAVVSTLKQKIEASMILKVDRSAASGLRTMGLAGQRSADDPFAGMKALGKKSRDEVDSKFAPTNSMKKDQAINQAVQLLIQAESTERDDSGVPCIDIRSYVKRGEDVVYMRKLCDSLEDYTHMFRMMKSHKHPSIENQVKSVERIFTLQRKVETLNHLLSNEALQLFPDFLQRKAVLHRLGYVDESGTVCIKGRVACEVNSCDELIATEMVFEGLLNEMDPEEIAAVLSALVYQEKKEEELDSELPDSIVQCCHQMKTIALNLGRLQKEAGLELDPSEYTDASLRFGLVHVVYEWALGVPFKSICELTDAQEGSIVRCITRLDELCREIRNCARVVGNPTLYRKMEAASAAIKRDIVFASSLYVS
jgi:antiviral helicase SKI2